MSLLYNNVITRVKLYNNNNCSLVKSQQAVTNNTHISHGIGELL